MAQTVVQPQPVVWSPGCSHSKNVAAETQEMDKTDLCVMLIILNFIAIKGYRGFKQWWDIGLILGKIS